MADYRNRLLEEWKQHSKIVIAVDFDDTISPWHFTSKEDEVRYEEIINLLIQCRATGAYITIFTASDKERYDEITKFCSSKGLTIDSINQNPIDLPYGNNGKIFANVYLDDRAGLDETVRMLEYVLYTYRGYLNHKNMKEYE